MILPCHYPHRGDRYRTSWLQDYRVKEYRLPSPPSFKCNVLRESLSVDSQNIPCTILKRRGSWVISAYLWIHPISYHSSWLITFHLTWPSLSVCQALVASREFQRDVVVYLGWPIAPSYMSPKFGGSGAQINFEDLALYLTHGCDHRPTLAKKTMVIFSVVS